MSFEPMRAAVLALALGACTVAAYPDPEPGYDAEYVDAPPPNVEAYPRVYYGGTYHYYVRGHWYRPYRNGWMYYRTAPPHLQRQRPYVQEAPPAR